ncbi:uncharacterized protein LOC112493718 isoform X2 [Cephus cinctus]|nr:uncharacterized protein LOC112493718 isoform X2 [Cephus cinctus]
MGHNPLYPPCSSLSAYPISNVPNTRYELSQLYPSSMLPPNNEVPGCICLPSNQTQPESNEVCEDACPGVADTTAGKVVSEIVNTGLPYKEIEAIINDNRMVIRIQKDPAENEFDPPCDCDDNNLSGLKTPAGEEKRFMGNQKGNNVVFQMASANPTQINQNTTLNRSCDQNDVGCRTVTVFPQVDVTPSAPAVPTIREDEKKEKKDKIDKPRMPRSIDLEENPNIFLLRIRKKSDNGEKKTNIDLEFRTPRPWRTETKPIEKVAPAKPHQEDTSKDKDEGKKKKKAKCIEGDWTTVTIGMLECVT